MTMEKQLLLGCSTMPKSKSKLGDFVLVIHGGAGTMSRERSTPEQQFQYKAALHVALRTGYVVLRDGGEAMDAAVAAVAVMEDCALFNSGKGAVFNVDGKNELESSIMLSKPPSSHPEIPRTRRGLAVTLLTHTPNPSHLARALYLAPELAPHTMLSGPAAESLGTSLGLPTVDPSYFFTHSRWREHRRGLGLPETPYPPGHPGTSIAHDGESLDVLPKGTVGAVALDIRGCLASVTSTGGRTNKLVGRIGDTPLMGAGFWAEEWEDKDKNWVRRAWERMIGKKKGRKGGVAVSGTGDGDYFIRLATASTIARRVRYIGEPLQEAAEWAVEALRDDGGDGGVIGLDLDGNVTMAMNCSGMHRGVIRSDGVGKTAIFSDEVLA